VRKIIVIPAVFIGCMIVIWVGTVATSNMPSQELLAPTTTAAAIATQAASASQTASGHQAGQKGLTHEDQTCTLPTSYPADILQWCDLIETSAKENNLPARLIAAVILQESGGDPQAYSSSGAVGLMQVMPRDGIASEFMCPNGPCFASRPTIEELEDPAFNVAYGSQMLAGLFQKHGSYREALFKYGPINMGYDYADIVLKIWESYQ
jgi:soluble lytic murein transglycosylase-like protein